VAISAPTALERPTVAARRDGDRITLRGCAEGVLNGAEADLLLIAVDLDGESMSRIALDRVDVSVERRKTWDGTRSLASVDLHDVGVAVERLLPVTVESESALARHGALALAADSIGGAAAVLEITIDYLKTRQQFGRPIGSFQALKHRVANLKTALVADTALVRSAAALEASGAPQAPGEVAAAKAQACRNYVEMAREAIQLHGGIGFTAEHVCHLFLKRARLNEALFGSASQHLDAVLEHFRKGVAA